MNQIDKSSERSDMHKFTYLRSYLTDAVRLSISGLSLTNKNYRKVLTASKVPVFEVFLVRIFSHSDWVRRDPQYSPYSDWIWENADQKDSKYGDFSRSV